MNIKEIGPRWAGHVSLRASLDPPLKADENEDTQKSNQKDNDVS